MEECSRIKDGKNRIDRYFPNAKKNHMIVKHHSRCRLSRECSQQRLCEFTLYCIFVLKYFQSTEFHVFIINSVRESFMKKKGVDHFISHSCGIFSICQTVVFSVI